MLSPLWDQFKSFQVAVAAISSRVVLEKEWLAMFFQPEVVPVLLPSARKATLPCQLLECCDS